LINKPDTQHAAIGKDVLSITLDGGPVAPVRSGTLKGLGVMNDTRVGAIKDVPTFAEAGSPTSIRLVKPGRYARIEGGCASGGNASGVD
jgi:hypothetical protein